MTSTEKKQETRYFALLSSENMKSIRSFVQTLLKNNSWVHIHSLGIGKFIKSDNRITEIFPPDKKKNHYLCECKCYNITEQN